MRKGFTLTEILIYIAILAIIISAVSSFFLWQINSGAKSRAIREVQYNTEQALSIMTKEIREAKSVYTPTSIFDVNLGQLSLETATSYIDFFLCGTRLCQKKESQDPIALTSGMVQINNLIFNYIATTSTVPSIQVNLKINYNDQASFGATSTVSLRSY
ncbi:MAG: prepilin-type N-terminal cleavage/methylation domain-containing protein [Patescibacteria group bacterium]